MNGLETVAIQGAVTIATFAAFAWKVGRRDGIWEEKFETLAAGQEDIRKNMMSEALCAAQVKAREQHFDALEDRLDSLEGITILPREIDAMQKGYREALATLAGNMNDRFTNLEKGQLRLREDVVALSHKVDGTRSG